MMKLLLGRICKVSVLVFSVIMISSCSGTSKTQTSMSIRQSILRTVYPALTGITKLFGVNNRVVMPEQLTKSTTSVYDFNVELISGDTLSLAAYKGKKIVIVNTASDCGYTGQYEELQQLYASNKDSLVIIGFPANDFKQQEKGSNEEIATFCKKNYGVEFPIAAKTSVVKGDAQHPLFKWLSDPLQNGWNKEAPAWNFSKYVISEDGILLGYVDPGISPLGKEFTHILAAKIP
ncbi:MAG: glutathione peroxidase [bacterium]